VVREFTINAQRGIGCKQVDTVVAREAAMAKDIPDSDTRSWHEGCADIYGTGISGQENAMQPTTLAEFDIATATFLASHRNCPVEITISGLDCHYAADCGMLRRMELVQEPNGSAQLNIVLCRGDHTSSVKMIRQIHSINMTGRTLTVDAGKGVHENLECLSPHDADGREKLLLIRHLAAIGQA
jgi:hypothetical protein